jgi:hypothetical protein
MKPNKAKDRFLKSFPDLSVADHADRLANNMAFSFQYFDISQEPASGFSDLTEEQLRKTILKIQSYSANTIEYWKNQRIGGGGNHVLEIYGDFPRKSDFMHPKSVPSDVLWARFRLESDMRLIGFFIPHDLCAEHKLAKNIFYVIFIDEHHRFYKTAHDD